MNFEELQAFGNDHLLLTRIAEQDRPFVLDLFSNADVRKFYTVSIDILQDYRKLVDYCLQDITAHQGYAWIIRVRNNLNPSAVPCGLIAFEFMDNATNARISYALSPAYRKQGIMTQCFGLLMDRLRAIGVTTVQADVDVENLDSERLLARLNFTKDHTRALLDRNDARMRHLWSKDIYDHSKLRYPVLDLAQVNELWTNNAEFKVFEEQVPLSNEFGLRHLVNKTGRYHMVFIASVSGKLVGRNDDALTRHRITWELLREEIHGPKKFMVFNGWDEPGTTSLFADYEIGIEKSVLAQIVANLMSNYPKFYTIEMMSRVIGLEGFRFSDGQIRI